MAKVALIGATGFVGSHILTELLDRHFDVVAIARSTETIQVKDGKPELVNIDITNTEALAEALKGVNVVISAFNPGWTNPNIYDDFLKGAESIQQAVRNAGVKRLIVIGGAGSLYDAEGKQFVDSDDFPAVAKQGALAARDYLEIIKRETYLDWTFFSPALEMDPSVKTGRTGKYELGTEHPVLRMDKRSVLSVEDLAVVIVDEVENHKFSRQRFTAGYAK